MLENLLTYSDRSISVGELHHLDSHLNKGLWGKTWNWNCSCGKSFDHCKFWTQVFEELNQKGVNRSLKTSIKYRKPYYKFFPKLSSNFDLSNNQNIIKNIGHIYESIFNVKDNEVIIDSSKNPLQGLAIYKNINYNVKIIHLKRDLGPLVLSKQKWHKKFSGNNSSVYKILMASIFFRMRSKSCLKRINNKDKITILYRDLAIDTQKTINTILDKFEISRFQVPSYMYFGENHHTIGGSPSRFEKREIKYDMSWESKIRKMPIFNTIAKAFNNI